MTDSQPKGPKLLAPPTQPSTGRPLCAQEFDLEPGPCLWFPGGTSSPLALESPGGRATWPGTLGRQILGAEKAEALPGSRSGRPGWNHWRDTLTFLQEGGQALGPSNGGHTPCLPKTGWSGAWAVWSGSLGQGPVC